MRLLVRSLLFTLLGITLSSVSAFSQTATIKTDQLDYPPGSTVIITGTGWQPGETVTLQILHDPTGGDDATNPSHFPWTITADASGNVSSTWTVPSAADELGATLQLTAVGGSSALTASWVFTDANKYDIFFQANGLPTNTSVTVNYSGTSNSGGSLNSSVTFSAPGPTGSSQKITIKSATPFTFSFPSISGYTFTTSVSSPYTSADVTGQLTIVATYKSTQTITFNNPGTKTYGNADFNLGATASSGLPVSYSVSSGPATIVSGNMLHITGAGSVTVVASQSGNSTYAAAADVVQTFTVNKANAILNIQGYSGNYDGNAHQASGTAKGAFSEDLSSLLSFGTGITNVPGGQESWSFAGNSNYNSTNGTVSIILTKADPTITVTPYSVTYDGNAHTATFSVKGVKGEVLSGMDVSATTHTNAGSYTTDAWKFTDVTGNYNDKSGTVDDEIAKADPTITVTPYSVTYDGNAHTATFSVKGVKGETLSGMDVSATTHTNAGSYTTDAWKFTDVTGNYNNKNGTVDDEIAKADPAITVTPYSVTYDGNAHTATFSVTGVKGEALSGMDVSSTTHTNAGSYTTDAWKFTDVTGNYNDKSGTVDDEIAKADPTITVTPYSVTYDGNAHTATFSVTGVKGEALSGMDVSSTTHTNAGSYTTDAWKFTDVTGNYNNKSGTVDDEIAKADPAITVTPYSVTYDGNAHTATFSVTGVKGEALSGMDVSSTTHTNAGSYTTDAWKFTDVTGNYNNKSGTVDDEIAKADPTITVTPYSVTYDGNAHTATFSVTGVKGEVLSGMDVSATTHTNAGSYTSDAWKFTDVTGNYNNKSGTVDDEIAKADPAITVTPYSVTYDGNAHTATFSVTGVKGEVLSGMDVSSTTHTNAGSYTTDAWKFTDVTGNYNNKNGTVDDEIAKADPTITVTPYSVTYDGNAHTATFSVTGVKGEVLSGMDVSSTTHTNAGSYTTDAWKFTDVTGNYNDKSGTVDDEIAKADPTITVTPYSVTYDGNAHTATFSVTGVKGEALSGMDVSATTHTNAGSYTSDAWKFTDVTGNYNNKSGTVDDEIAKADPAITVTPYSVTYDGNAHTATFSVTGVKGEALSGMDVSSTTHTNAGSYTTDAWKFTDVTGNYNNKNGTVDDEIAKADPAITVIPYSLTYDGNAHTATFSVTGVKGEALSGMDVSATTHTNAGSYTTDAWKFTDVTGNYNNKNGTVDDEIAKADPTISVTPYSVTYDGNAHTATFSVTGVKGEVLSGMDVSATTHTNAGSYTTDAWKFTDVTGNYNNKSGTVDDEIAKADPTISVTPYSVTYDGNAHTATFSVTGVKGEVLSGMDVSATTHTNAGSYTSDAWKFTDVTGNYNNKSGTVDDEIAKADPAITVTPYSVTYDGNAHTATFSVTGVKGEVLSGMDVSKTTHTNAGSYTTDAWKFTDVTGNYNNKSGTVDDEIAKADPAITVTPYSVTYDGNAHTATFSVTGVKGEVLSGMDVSTTTHTNAGSYTTDAWKFTDVTGNYNNKNGTVDDEIAKADPAITVTPYSVTYDGNAHTATFSVTGVKGEVLSGMDVSATTHTNAGSYTSDAWKFTDVTGNYNNKNGTVDDEIAKANSTVSITGGTFTYDGNQHAATGFAYGVGGINDVLSPALTFSYTGTAGAANTAYGPTATAPYQAGDYPVTGSFAGNNNYNSSSNSSKIVINNIPITGSASAVKINCYGQTTTLTANASGGDGTLQYSLNGGAYQNSNQFTVAASSTPYTVTVLDQDGFTFAMNGVTVTQPALLVTTASTSNPHLYFGAPGVQTATISTNISGGTAPYTVTVTMNRKLIFGYINSAGNEVWTALGGTSTHTTDSTAPPVTTISNVSAGTISLVTVALLQDADFTVTVTDANGCVQSSSSVHVIGEDARCFAGKSAIVKVQMCHLTGSAKNPTIQICVDQDAVQAHLNTGDYLGSCTIKTRDMNTTEVNPAPVQQQEVLGKLAVKVMPNPTSYYFNLSMKSQSKQNVNMTVVDVAGRVIEQRTDIPANSSFQLGNNYHPGVYFAEFTQGNDRVTLRLIKEGK